MTDLLKQLQAAADGEQPPENWQELFREAFYELLSLKSDCDVLKPLLDQASEKLSKLSQPMFRVGDFVTVWDTISGYQSDAKYGVGSGRHVNGKVEDVNFRYGRYVYSVDGMSNLSEDLIRKVG